MFVINATLLLRIQSDCSFLYWIPNVNVNLDKCQIDLGIRLPLSFSVLIDHICMQSFVLIWYKIIASASWASINCHLYVYIGDYNPSFIWAMGTPETKWIEIYFHINVVWAPCMLHLNVQSHRNFWNWYRSLKVGIFLECCH